MPEQHPQLPEQAHLPEHEHATEAQPVSEHSEADIETNRQVTLEASREQIEKQAATTESIKVGESAPEPTGQLAATRDLKEMAFQRTLIRNRKQLSKPSRALSRFIHQPAVDLISRASEKTIARPSGLLAGGLFALIGSSTLLYLAKHYGFQYNFLVFALLFVGGFIVGLLVEFGFRVLKGKRD